MHLVLSLRIKRIILLMVCAFGALTSYLFHLQTYHSQFFLQRSRRNFLRQEQIDSPRGNITDKHNALVVTNRPVYSIFWQGTGHSTLTAEQEAQLTQLIILYPLEPELIEKLKQAEKRTHHLKLIDDVPYELLTQIIEQLSHSKNLVIKKTYERHYPHNHLACHIVGYLGLKDALGKMGLERLYNKKLTGQSGKIIQVINSLGRKLKTHNVTLPSIGMTLQTTLDLSLQHLAERLFPQEYEGCLLLMDDEGALEVVLSRPSFAPELFLKPLSYEQWTLLQQNNRFINRAFNACYPPASLFKIVTLAAAIETGIIAQDAQWNCIGHSSFKGRDYHCKKITGHGKLSTKKAFALSCNIPFYEIGKTIPIDTLALYANKLCLGSKTGIFFPEQEGLVPTTAWKRKVRNEPWWPGETLSAVIGQSSLLVTPLQIARMISSVCSGYKVKPRILVEEPIVLEPLEISQRTLAFLRSCLSSVIHEGSGTQLKSLEGFTIKGKSGTAQVRSLGKTPSSKKDLCHGYFAAHFQYKGHKPRTLVIFLEHAGSSHPAIRLARQFLDEMVLLEKDIIQ